MLFLPTAAINLGLSSCSRRIYRSLIPNLSKPRHCHSFLQHWKQHRHRVRRSIVLTSYLRSQTCSISGSSKAVTGNFSYTPLSPGEFRLVKLVWQAQDPDAPVRTISVSLEHYSLDHPPAYAALSYTWGAPCAGCSPEWDDPNATLNISVNGKDFGVRWNLAAALLRLCSGEELSEYQLIWIDAICIDQLNIQERNSGVRTMKDIYSTATCTFIWLGSDHHNNSAVGLKALQALAQVWTGRSPEAHELYTKFETRQEGELDIASIQSLNSEVTDAVTEEQLEAVLSLFTRRWMSRAWVVQEAAMSTFGLIWCGDNAPVGWEVFQAACALLEQHNMINMSRGDYSPGLINMWVFRARQFSVLIDAAQERAQNIQKDLPDALFRHQRFEASDPRDKVYSALGLTSDVDLVVIDYNLTVMEIFMQTCTAWTLKHNSLKFLKYCGQPTKLGLPSWVPDWTILRTRQAFHPFGMLDVSSLVENSVYVAGGIARPQMRILDSCLMTNANRVGLITYVGPMYKEKNLVVINRIEEEHVANDLAISMVSDFSKMEQIYSDLKELDWSVLLQGSSEKTSSGALIYGPTMEPIQLALRNTLLAAQFTDSSGKNRTANMTELQVEFVKYAQRIFPRMLINFVDRNIATTSRGHLALVPELTKVGDTVFLIQGNDMPYILREAANGEWKFIGECYVHGIMYGEALEETVVDGKYSWEEVRIV